MSSKLSQSIAVQRQIPEHVRETYPAFVEFVKVYYGWLQDTQSQNLEGIRDLDTTLDEFIGNFKSELAKNLPIELAEDPRKLLKHLREFYLSRGSEDSFKFLFRTLFNKEATLAYPSTQVLRVSDGKWKQDVSIFVEMTGDTTTLAPVNGSFITIQTSKKKIQTYVENILEYSLNVFEVFIQRDYLNEIEVGSTISATIGGVTYTGKILPCPSKIKIFKPGKGFKIGDLYALKTSLGRGCVIKITKVDSNGGIRAFQIIRFGLDYKTTFYSYLSSKDIAAWEYVHPLQTTAAADTRTYTAANSNAYQTYSVTYTITQDVPSLDVKVTRSGKTFTPIFQATTGNNVTIQGLQTGDVINLRGLSTPSYIENSGGFYDYGFASKQTYFFYDETIPVGSDDHRADRFFAEPSYVGEIVQQFYADTTTQVIDEDIAIIEINLGAVAKYPGYYLKADGFISDEMYIHDGKYYQAFSYVIKVEEELRKYADIVKSLLHPAGMRAYSEYSIFNNLQLSISQNSSKRLLQFSDTDAVYDGGFGFTKYQLTFDGNEVTTSLVDGASMSLDGSTTDASLVISAQGKVAFLGTKNITENVSWQYQYADKTRAGSLNVDTGFTTPPKAFSKNLLTDAVTLPYVYADGSIAGSLLPSTNNTTPPKSVDKIIPVNASGGITLNAAGQRVGDLAIPNDSGFGYDAYTITLNGTVVTHTPSGNQVLSSAGAAAYITSKLHTETTFTSDTSNRAFTKNMPEEILLSIDVPSKAFTKNMPEDTTSAIEVSLLRDYTKNHDETLLSLDQLSNAPTKNLPEDLASAIDKYFNTPELIKADTQSIADDGKAILTKLDIVQLFATEVYTKDYTKNHVETLTLSNILLGHDITKNHVETLIANDAVYVGREKNLPEELLSLIDAYNVGEFTKNLTESLTSIEASYVKDYTKSPSDSINITSPGLIRLNPYGIDDPSTGYFTPMSDYNASTAIT